MHVSDTLAFLHGGWQLDRVLDDRRSGVRGHFTGRALALPVTGQPPELSYTESGELRFGGHTGPASRRLVLRGRPDGTADVRFADGRLFFLLDLRDGSWQAVHGCGADRYRLTYRVLADDVLEERWEVRGAAKDYTATTRLRRG
jgi:Family of unknown function (DUF6314)